MATGMKFRGQVIGDSIAGLASAFRADLSVFMKVLIRPSKTLCSPGFLADSIDLIQEFKLKRTRGSNLPEHWARKALSKRHEQLRVK
ncbi:hypothetical protein [Caballeronia ptereochthonis]|jgi:hypothetical protein|uniref:hypothetical protein n=1 Tax=Caballeronia ptereochthonis TaxID=1777144 RepID=UPI000B3597A9|nr:hypothetical protein [Caballeronia ptereochthonis]